jgi:putative ABC transport system substrate-binding protein
MRRRALLFGAAALPFALRARAQPAGKVYRVGFILTTSPVAEMQGSEPAHPLVRDFLRAMRRLGYVEGKNFVLERRSAEGKYERFGEIVAELLRLKPDAIVTIGIPLTLAAKKLTSSVPIIFYVAGAGDPVAAGIVPGLSHPGGNITGFVGDPGPEIFGKRVQLLREAVPNVSRIAFLGLGAERSSAGARSAEAATKELGLSFFFAEAQADDYSAAFEEIKRQRADAIVVGAHPAHWTNRAAIAQFAARSRIADIHSYTEAAEVGGLMSYGSGAPPSSQAASYLDRIFKGAKPGDLPVQRPTTFALAVNLKAARARGLTIPQSLLLLRADRVIE